MTGIGFGLERIAWFLFERPRLAAAALAIVVALAGLGMTRLTFDEDLRDVFAGNSASFQDYVKATSEFVDPENELLVLVEGDRLGAPDNFQKLQDFQFELQLVDGVDNVYSPFALRDPPDANGNSALIVNDPGTGLTPALAERIRAHPVLGAKLLSADGKAMTFIVTPSRAEGAAQGPAQLADAVRATAADVFAGTGIKATVTGFPVVRAAIADIIKPRPDRPQRRRRADRHGDEPAGLPLRSSPRSWRRCRRSPPG